MHIILLLIRQIFQYYIITITLTLKHQQTPTQYQSTYIHIDNNMQKVKTGSKNKSISQLNKTKQKAKNSNVHQQVRNQNNVSYFQEIQRNRPDYQHYIPANSHHKSNPNSNHYSCSYLQPNPTLNEHNHNSNSKSKSRRKNINLNAQPINSSSRYNISSRSQFTKKNFSCLGIDAGLIGSGRQNKNRNHSAYSKGLLSTLDHISDLGYYYPPSSNQKERGMEKMNYSTADKNKNMKSDINIKSSNKASTLSFQKQFKNKMGILDKTKIEQKGRCTNKNNMSKGEKKKNKSGSKLVKQELKINKSRNNDKKKINSNLNRANKSEIYSNNDRMCYIVDDEDGNIFNCGCSPPDCHCNILEANIHKHPLNGNKYEGKSKKSKCLNINGSKSNMNSKSSVNNSKRNDMKYVSTNYNTNNHAQQQMNYSKINNELQHQVYSFEYDSHKNSNQNCDARGDINKAKILEQLSNKNSTIKKQGQIQMPNMSSGWDDYLRRQASPQMNNYIWEQNRHGNNQASMKQNIVQRRQNCINSTNSNYNQSMGRQSVMYREIIQESVVNQSLQNQLTGKMTQLDKSMGQHPNSMTIKKNTCEFKQMGSHDNVCMNITSLQNNSHRSNCNADILIDNRISQHNSSNSNRHSKHSRTNSLIQKENSKREGKLDPSNKQVVFINKSTQIQLQPQSHKLKQIEALVQSKHILQEQLCRSHQHYQQIIQSHQRQISQIKQSSIKQKQMIIKQSSQIRNRLCNIEQEYSRLQIQKKSIIDRSNKESLIQIENFNVQKTELIKKICAIQKQKSVLETKIDYLNKDNSILKNQAQRLAEEKGKYEKAIKKYENQINELESRLSKQIKKNKQSQTTIDLLRKQKKQILQDTQLVMQFIKRQISQCKQKRDQLVNKQNMQSRQVNTFKSIIVGNYARDQYQSANTGIKLEVSDFNPSSNRNRSSNYQYN